MSAIGKIAVNPIRSCVAAQAEATLALAAFHMGSRAEASGVRGSLADEGTAPGGDLFHWAPGHTARAGADSEVVLFSPQHEHGAVIEHMLGKMRG